MFKLVLLFVVMVMAAAKPGVLAPVAYTAVVPGSSSLSQYSSSVVHGPSASVYYAAPGFHGAPALYNTPTLSLSHNTPAVVLDAVSGLPLDTPEVVAARVAHYHAKTLSGHYLRKRSLSAVTPLAYSAPVSFSGPVVSTLSSPVISTYSAPIVSTYSAISPYPSPVSYTAVLPKAYGVHPW